ncbi:hypothetical protein CQW23_14015 [Capsicum baccatum]|uniref:Ubiquitin-like protease family profile domain-containing protein n=1 Tax=Capsicum baccatum TaxID=33114 RepID=A0A2G2WHX9_CAPBA|nr:hypothetical protein CQW23_14015 [Capsicum baccatum]
MDRYYPGMDKYVFSDIVFTDEEELEFNLGAIHQDSLGHEHHNDSYHSIPPITEDAFSVLKNEISNVRSHMSLFQEKVDIQFNGMREFVEESVKLILNELRFVKKQSSEFIEKEHVDVGLQIPPASKKQNEVLVDPVIEKYSFRDDVSVPLDVMNNPVNDQSPFVDKPFFTESQLVALERTFRELETTKAHIATPIMFDKSPVGVYNQSDTSCRRCPLYSKSKHPFQEYIGFKTPNSLIQQFTDWCYPKSRGKRESFHWILVIFRIRHKCLYVYDSMMEGVVHSKNVLDHVRSLSTMIPLFLVSTNFYGKRSNIYWHREAAYIDKSLSEPSEYVVLKDTPQQRPQSKIMPDESRMMEQSVKVRQLEMLLASMVVSKDLGNSLEVQGHDNTSHKML